MTHKDLSVTELSKAIPDGKENFALFTSFFLFFNYQIVTNFPGSATKSISDAWSGNFQGDGESDRNIERAAWRGTAVTAFQVE
jgi:hypothetical protein